MQFRNDSNSDSSTASDPLDADSQLRQLGMQLESEATALSRRYPPPKVCSATTEARTSRAYVGRHAALHRASAAAAALAVCAIVWTSRPQPPEAAPPRTTTLTTDEKHELADTDDVVIAEDRRLPSGPLGRSARGSAARAETVSVLHEVSGPELEGLIDLLESQDGASTSISI